MLHVAKLMKHKCDTFDTFLSFCHHDQKLEVNIFFPHIIHVDVLKIAGSIS